jgi:hypothetical protein
MSGAASESGPGGPGGPDARPPSGAGPSISPDAVSISPAPPGSGPAPVGNEPAPSRSRGVRGWLGRRFPRETDEERTVSGYAADARYGWAYLVAAFALGIAFAVLWLWMIRGEPIPPGDDPSTWIATSYYFIGVPAPSGVQPLAYPPAAFPFVGISVWLGGGPLLGGRIFMAAMIALLGPVAYVFGRAVLKRPSLALLGAGLLLAEPDFQQLYYFGGYPNIFALLFMLLALAYLVRWLRSRQPSHLLIFWAAATVSILSHSLTAAVLAGTVLFVVVALILVRRLPRGFIWSRAGAIGAAIMAIGVGGYYGGTALLGVSHPSYLSSSSLGGTKAQLVPTVLRPFYLANIAGAVEHQTVSISADQALVFMALVSALILGLFLLALWKRPGWITPSWLVLAATVLTVFVGTVGGYVANLPVDYRRFPYFLYFPIILALLLFADIAIEYLLRRRAPRRLPAPVIGGRRPPPRYRRSLTARRWVEPILLVLAVVAILVSVQYYTVPAGNSYEAYYTEYGHNSAFLSVVNALEDTGIPGNILSTTPLIGHWPSTLTTRTTYDPAAIGGNSYAASQVTQGETTELVTGARITVTNGLVAASIPGIEPGNFNSSPVFGAFNQNLYQPILQFPTAAFEVGSIKGPVTLFSPAGSGAPEVRSIDGGTGYTMLFVGPGATLTETVVAVPATATVEVTFNASQASNASPLAFVQARATLIGSIPGIITNATTPGSFDWFTNTTYGNFTAIGSASPVAALSNVIPNNNVSGTLSTAVFHEAAANLSAGATSLSFTVSLTDPGASNVASGLGPYIVADQVWQNWSIRFILLFSGSAQARPLTQVYYETEYGAALVATATPYALVLLPTPYGGPAYLTQNG